MRFLLIFGLFFSQTAYAKAQYYYLTGIIENMEPRGGRIYLVIKAEEVIPGKYSSPIEAETFRISTSKRLYSHLKIGQVVNFPVKAQIPDPPLTPNGFDWGQYLKNKGIDATGYGMGKIVVVRESEELTFTYKIRQFRLNLAEHLYNTAPTPSSGAFAAALITGVRGYLTKDTVEAMRASGLAHLLAISGMHMAMVSGLIYMLIRRLLAFNHTVNAKKPAAFFAILAAFAYLLLAGAPVSTQRAFIMTTIILLAILVDRQALSLWSLGLAAIAVIAIDAQAVTGVGFQLSFTAAAILILYYRQPRQPFKQRDTGQKVLNYFIGLFVVTLYINVITAPMVAYHFHKVPLYGAIGNLIAIPLTGLLIMPLLIVSVLSLPLGLEQYFLSLAHWPLYLLEQTAQYLARLPHAVMLFPPLSGGSVWLITAGMFIILAGHYYAKWRWVGLVPVIAGSYFAFPTIPDYVISHDGRILGKITANKVIAIGWKPSRFVAEKWAEHYGKPDYEIIKCKEDPCQLDHYIIAGMYQGVETGCTVQGATVITKLETPKGCNIIRPTGNAQEIFYPMAKR